MKRSMWMESVLRGLIVGIACLLTPVRGRSATNGLIAVLGSSVAKGYAAGGGTVGGSYALGYAGLLTSFLKPLDWGVTNLSVSSDTITNILNTLEDAVVPADPDHVFLGLSLSDAGLAGASDPDAVLEGFRATLTNIIGHARAHGLYAMAGLCYPNNNYSVSEYARVKAMNLLINSYDLPSANFLGAVDDGKGHWVEGYYSDSGHPNALGHEELFYTIVPSLFDAIRLGKTACPAPVGDDGGYAIVTRDAAVHDPIRFTPEDTVHSFTTAFRVRSACTGTVAAVICETSPGELRSADRIFVDFGPTDPTRGHPAPSPDQNDNHWNNWQASGGWVAVGTTLADLIKTSGATSSVALVVTAAFDGPNGGSSYGGLMAPDPALLGDFAVANATEDYFGTGGTSKFKITGLDRGFTYTLRFFGTRVMDGSTRTTRYTATAGNGNTYATNLVTTGTDVGTGGYDGNNDTVAELRGLQPDANGAIEVGVTMVSGYAYLNIMEIRVEEVAPLSLSDRIFVDFGPTDPTRGHPAPSPDQNGNHWNSWRYSGGVPAGAALPGLVRTSGTTTPVELVVTAAFDGSNGGSSYGGLMAPDPALLGDFAVANATEDYFGTGGTSKFKIKGLDRRFTYTLRFFGTRELDDSVRVTRYTANTGNGATYATNLVTTGTDVGTGGYDGNNDTIAELRNLPADANGEIEVNVTMVSGHAYLNIMEIAVTGTVEDDPDSLLVDFGPDDGINGHAMASPDSNGRHWNTFVPPIGAGRILPNMIDAYSAKTTTVSLAITKAFVSHNGINTGGLLVPSAALLGDFAQAHATEDYFHTQADGSSLMISGLNKASVYMLRFFGTREAPDVRETCFTAETGNGSYTTTMVTSGTDVGAGGYDGNNDTIAELTGLVPDTRGRIVVNISNVQGTQCYLGIMEIKKERSVTGTGRGTVELRTNALVYVASSGHALETPVSLDGKRWYDVAVSHCHAGQVTRLFVDGLEIGHLPERLAPTAFVLGGEGTATANRMEGPQEACYQDWCVYRSAWNADEAAAHAAGAMQQASMEICAALADRHFVQGVPVDNRAQSLSEAVVNTSLIKQKPTGTTLLLR